MNVAQAKAELAAAGFAVTDRHPRRNTINAHQDTGRYSIAVTLFDEDFGNFVSLWRRHAGGKREQLLAKTTYQVNHDRRPLDATHAVRTAVTLAANITSAATQQGGA